MLETALWKAVGTSGWLWAARPAPDLHFRRRMTIPPTHIYGDENFAPPFPHTQKRMAIAPNPLKSCQGGPRRGISQSGAALGPKNEVHTKKICCLPPFDTPSFCVPPRFSQEEQQHAQKITRVGPPLGLGIDLGSPQAMGDNNDCLTLAAALLFDRPSRAANRP